MTSPRFFADFIHPGSFAPSVIRWYGGREADGDEGTDRSRSLAPT